MSRFPSYHRSWLSPQFPQPEASPQGAKASEPGAHAAGASVDSQVPDKVAPEVPYNYDYEEGSPDDPAQHAS